MVDLKTGESDAAGGAQASAPDARSLDIPRFFREITPDSSARRAVVEEVEPTPAPAPPPAAAAPGAGDTEDDELRDDSFDAAELIAALTEPSDEFPVSSDGVELRDMIVRGPFDLSDCGLTYPLRLIDCLFTDEVRLERLDVPGLDLSGCRFEQGINAHGLTVRGDLGLARVLCRGALDLSRARVDGKLDLGQSWISLAHRATDQSPGLTLSQGSVRGDLDLTLATIDGGLFFLGAEIGGTLSARGAQIGRPGRTAVLGEGASIAGSLDLGAVPLVRSHAEDLARHAGRLGPEAPPSLARLGDLLPATEGQPELRLPTEVAGAIRIDAIAVVGDLRLSGLALAADLRALSAARAIVGGDVHIDEGARAAGTVDLQGAKVGGNLIIRGARLGPELPGDVAAIDASDAAIGGDVIAAGPETRLTGPLVLNRVKVRGGLFLRGVTIESRRAASLQARGIEIGSRLFLDQAASLGHGAALAGARIDGEVYIARASLGAPVAIDEKSVRNAFFQGSDAVFRRFVATPSGEAAFADWIGCKEGERMFSDWVHGATGARHFASWAKHADSPSLQSWIRSGAAGGDWIETGAAEQGFRARVESDLGGTGFLDWLQADGPMDTKWLDVAPAIDLSDATVSGLTVFPSAAIAGDVRLDRLTVKGDAALNLTPLATAAEPKVSLMGADVTGTLALRADAPVGDLVLDLSRAAIGVLDDRQQAWPRAGRLRLEGVSIGSFSESAPRSFLARTEFLARQRPRGEKRRTDLSALGAVVDALHAAGARRAATRMGLSGIRARMARLPLLVQPGALLVDLLTGYGFRAHRLAVVAVALVLGTAWFADAAHRAGQLVPAPGVAGRASFNAVGYALDRVVPLADLGYADAWREVPKAGPARPRIADLSALGIGAGEIALPGIGGRKMAFLFDLAGLAGWLVFALATLVASGRLGGRPRVRPAEATTASGPRDATGHPA